MLNARLIVGFVLAFLLLGFSVYWRSRVVEPNVQTIAKQIERNVARELIKMNNDASVVLDSIRTDKKWPSSIYVFHLHDSNGVKQWNSNTAVPDLLDFNKDTVQIVSNGGSFFLAKRYSIGLDNKYLIGFILLQERYPIQNQYLVNTLNTSIFPEIEIQLGANGLGTPIFISGSPVFYFSLNPTYTKIYETEWLGWLCLGVGICLLLLMMWKLTKAFLEKRLVWIASGVAFLVLLLIRLIMVYGGYPGNLKSIPIFDSAQFASSTFSDSIGNFFLNTVAFAMAGWITYQLVSNPKSRFWSKQKVEAKLLMNTFLLILCFGFHLLPFLYLETIFHNSSITVDISQQLYVDPVRFLALGCVVLSTLTGFYFFYPLYRTVFTIANRHQIVFLVPLAIAVLAVFVYHIYTERTYEIPMVATIIHLLILYYSTITKGLKFIADKKFSFVLLALLIFSTQAALTIRMLSLERQHKAMVRYGNSFLVERDVLGEYLLDQATSTIASDVFIQNQLTNPFNRLGSISQKIKRSHLNSYFDRYEIKISLYDGRGFPMGSEMDLPLDSLRQSLQRIELAGSTSPAFLGRNTSTQNVNHYVAIIPVRATVSGFVVLNLVLREVSPVSVFPKLLLDARYSHYASGLRYSHAIYHNGVLQNSSGSFKYELNKFNFKLSNPKLFRLGLEANGYYHIALEDLSGRVAIVSAKAYSVFDLITNFSFLFLLGLVVCIVSILISVLRNFNGSILTYSGRIQFYVYAALILPLVAIGVTTLRLNSMSEQDHSEGENMDKANRLAQNLAQLFVLTPDNWQDELISQTRAVGVDASVFSSNGQLLATTQPDIYTNQLMSRLIDPVALHEINRENFLFTFDDLVGKLKFRNTYAAIRSPLTGEIVAILSVPYFESQQAGEQNQLRLASNIWTVFAIVFLLFYLLSFFALDWLTRPLQIIANSLKRTTLSGSNRKLSWNSHDEIGAMVNEYNNMVDNLEKSKAELARKQREATWREMARQVAHEIKNPLTPIKLTLQQMEKSIREGTAQTDKNIQSVKTVLHQVDILNDIASSFSAFAQMPEITLGRTNLVQLMNETVALYRNTEPHTIVWNPLNSTVWIMADTKLFVRIFGNIILNAFQSNVGGAVQIIVELKIRGAEVLVSFSDNGPGMQPDILDKIFIPYFSTKETGSGLGLAMAKQGIEHSGGRIWCESKVGQGSVFHISLPIVE